MQLLTVKVSNKVLDKLSNFLKNFPSDQIDIIENKPITDLSFLEKAI